MHHLCFTQEFDMLETPCGYSSSICPLVIFPISRMTEPPPATGDRLCGFPGTVVLLFCPFIIVTIPHLLLNPFSQGSKNVERSSAIWCIFYLHVDRYRFHWPYTL
ncbi:hypothetical protein BDZ94DRAFT_485196 [Collybia nuda]|uniref:Uncharacterized protein n=1 Tax=Collybia nuda TaxID=64659 RepID=A0A9P5Y6Q4_9AGAR|nr:hypothetical protein BDZ94DRAFT_485196 [Collybia nuda]